MTTDGLRNAPDVVDVVALGDSMVTFLPGRPGRLADVPPGDPAPPPARAYADRLAALDDGAWGRLRLGPGWTRAGQAAEEARTP